MTILDAPLPPGTPCWVDLFTSDEAASRAFYSELLGWEILPGRPDFGGYALAQIGGHNVAGIMPNSEGGPDVWSTYIAVTDAEATTAAATAAGATVLAPPLAVGPLGTMAVLFDPIGGAFGLWQPAEHTGFQLVDVPGAVAWDEYHSKDFATSRAFYGDLFGWTYRVMSDTDDFRYITAEVDGNPVGGMMDSAGFLPEQVPSHWAVYFTVEDADAAQATAVRLGATVLRPAEDSPFGRIVDLVDPTGAAFKLHSQTLSDGTKVFNG
ncbi:VOC family protein [Nakamurella sp. YIM 132087]|uniref:VOC family protein n=1 Tax=Nakamurella alba TaxID=2665158 RepID=A0A7K1FNX4_9ACTN|nr:VOC family protein [Nakamurella alba]MTD15862.1 VOC family protein [Nakamurella alba]